MCATYVVNTVLTFILPHCWNFLNILFSFLFSVTTIIYFSFQFPNLTSVEDPPYFLFAGPSNYLLSLEKVDPSANIYSFQYNMDSNETATVVGFAFDTPGSKVFFIFLRHSKTKSLFFTCNLSQTIYYFRQNACSTQVLVLSLGQGQRFCLISHQTTTWRLKLPTKTNLTTSLWNACWILMDKSTLMLYCLWTSKNRKMDSYWSQDCTSRSITKGSQN